jgi:hypothetical protein
VNDHVRTVFLICFGTFELWQRSLQYFFWQKSQMEFLAEEPGGIITSGSRDMAGAFPQHRTFPLRAMFRRFPADSVKI